MDLEDIKWERFGQALGARITCRERELLLFGKTEMIGLNKRAVYLEKNGGFFRKCTMHERLYDKSKTLTKLQKH